jgi:hypothetical protein
MFSVTDATVYAPYGPGNMPLVTQGLSATEAAQGVVRAYSELLGSRADVTAASQPESIIASASNTLVAGIERSPLPC